VGVQVHKSVTKRQTKGRIARSESRKGADRKIRTKKKGRSGAKACRAEERKKG